VPTEKPAKIIETRDEAGDCNSEDRVARWTSKDLRKAESSKKKRLVETKRIRKADIMERPSKPKKRACDPRKSQHGNSKEKGKTFLQSRERYRKDDRRRSQRDSVGTSQKKKHPFRPSGALESRKNAKR